MKSPKLLFPGVLMGIWLLCPQLTQQLLGSSPSQSFSKEGKFCPRVGETAERANFQSFKGRITPWELLAAALTLSKCREGEFSIMVFNSVPELEEIILKHAGIKEITCVCHQKPFIRVNICLWQQNSWDIF